MLRAAIVGSDKGAEVAPTVKEAFNLENSRNTCVVRILSQWLGQASFTASQCFASFTLGTACIPTEASSRQAKFYISVEAAVSGVQLVRALPVDADMSVMELRHRIERKLAEKGALASDGGRFIRLFRGQGGPELGDNGAALNMMQVSAGSSIAVMLPPSKSRLPEHGYAIGIDIGRTNSRIAAFVDGSVIHIPNQLGECHTPCQVAFEGEHIVVGKLAQIASLQHPKHTVTHVPFFLGKNVSDDVADWPFLVTSDQNGEYLLGTRRVSAIKLTAIILKDLARAAEAYLGSPVKRVVLSVPNSFGLTEKRALKDATVIAGLQCLRMNKACILALSPLVDDKMHHYVVVDVGGSSTKTAVLEVEEGVYEALSFDSDNTIGGRCPDEILVQHFSSKFDRVNKGSTIFEDSLAMRRLREACESAKCCLSVGTSANIHLRRLHNSLDLHEQITRAHFEQLADTWLRRILRQIRKTIESARVCKQDIDGTFLIGGCARIPRLVWTITEYFEGTCPVQVPHSPDDAVVAGAAMCCAQLTGELALSKAKEYFCCENEDMIMITIGIATAGGSVAAIAKRGFAAPVDQTCVFTTPKISSDHAYKVTIRVVGGERLLEQHSVFFGDLKLLLPAKAGLPEQPCIYVRFRLQPNGFLHVHAWEQHTGVEADVVLNCRIAASDIARMVRLAEQNGMSDAEERAEIAKEEGAILHSASDRPSIPVGVLPILRV